MARPAAAISRWCWPLTARSPSAGRWSSRAERGSADLPRRAGRARRGRARGSGAALAHPAEASDPPHRRAAVAARPAGGQRVRDAATRSEEHTSELQSQSNLVCRLLLEKKKKT